MMMTLPKKRLLYLDDEAVCLSMFKQAFDDLYDVRTASSPGEARIILSRHPTDIIITDSNMPEMSGKEFLREVRESYPASYRIMMTGYSIVGDVITELCMGLIDLFIAKPWDIAEMWQILERASASSEQRADAHSSPIQYRKLGLSQVGLK